MGLVNKVDCTCYFGEFTCDQYVGEIKGKKIYVDGCIASEIKELLKAGIKTKGSCCGHGHVLPSAWISAEDVKSLDILKELGYEDITEEEKKSGGLSEGVRVFKMKSILKYERLR